MFEIKLILKWIHVCVVGVFIQFYGDGKCMQIHFSGGKKNNSQKFSKDVFTNHLQNTLKETKHI